MARRKRLYELYPNGMSKKQQEELRHSWFETYGNPYTSGKKYNEVWSKEIRIMEEGLSAISMLTSCFVYGGIQGFYYQHEAWEYCGEGSHYDHYLADFIKEGGTKEEFDKIIENQIRYFEKCSSRYAGTDSEGGSYRALCEPEEETA